MTTLTREQIIAAADLDYAEVNVPEWGGTVRLRAWDGATRDRFDAMALQARERGQQMPPQLRAWIVAMSVCNEHGELMFSESDVPTLARKSARALDRIVEAALRLNGLTPDAIEAAGKGFGAAQSD